MNLKKRILSILSAAALVVSMSCVSVFAAANVIGDKEVQSWDAAANVAACAARTATTGTPMVVLPATLKGTTWTSNGTIYDVASSDPAASIPVKWTSSPAITANGDGTYTFVTAGTYTFTAAVDTTGAPASNYAPKAGLTGYPTIVATVTSTTIPLADASTIVSGFAGKTKSEIQGYAAAYFATKHFTNVANDFNQTSGTATLNDTTVKTVAGGTYVFTATTPAHAGYTTAALSLSYTYNVSGGTPAPSATTTLNASGTAGLTDATIRSYAQSAFVPYGYSSTLNTFSQTSGTATIGAGTTINGYYYVFTCSTVYSSANVLMPGVTLTYTYNVGTGYYNSYTSYTITNGTAGYSLLNLQNMAQQYFQSYWDNTSYALFTLTSASTSLSTTGTTVAGGTYVLQAYNNTPKAGYYGTASTLTFTYTVAGGITQTKITNSNGSSGKTRAYVEARAIDAFAAYHYSTANSFTQTGGSTLSSTSLTSDGRTYTFTCYNAVAATGYSVAAGTTLTYVYDVDDYDTTKTTKTTTAVVSDPTVGSKTGWSAIEGQLASSQAGSKVVVKMNNTSTVPASTFTAIKGRDIITIFDFGTYAWQISGKNVTAPQSVNLAAIFGGSNISASTVNALAGSRSTTQLELSYTGKFGFKGALTTYMSTTQAGKYANLYYYNPSTGKLEFQSAGLISSGGYATLNFNHASDYVIVVDNAAMGAELAAGEGVQDNAELIK